MPAMIEPVRPAATILCTVSPDERQTIPGPQRLDEALRALNPLQHLPLVGTTYGAAGGASLPAASGEANAPMHRSPRSERA